MSEVSVVWFLALAWQGLSMCRMAFGFMSSDLKTDVRLGRISVFLTSQEMFSGSVRGGAMELAWALISELGVLMFHAVPQDVVWAWRVVFAPAELFVWAVLMQGGIKEGRVGPLLVVVCMAEVLVALLEFYSGVFHTEVLPTAAVAVCLLLYGVGSLAVMAKAY